MIRFLFGPFRVRAYPTRYEPLDVVVVRDGSRVWECLNKHPLLNGGRSSAALGAGALIV